MILSKPTKFGSGLTIYGDYWDLKNLHTTIHKLCESPPLDGALGDIAIGLAYDIRHAYQRDREIKKFGQNKYDKVSYYGVKIIWPMFLVQLALLRWAASFQTTSKIEQSHLFILEACAEGSLISYEPKTGKECFHWLTSFSGFPTNYFTEFIYDCTRDYVSQKKTGKERFKTLPKFINMLSPNSMDYRKYALNLKDLAKKKGCKPENLTGILEEWSDFKW